MAEPAVHSKQALKKIGIMIEPANPPTKGDTAAAGGRALVVEDNRTNQAIIAAILQSLDFDVSIANDGAQAVEAVLTRSSE